VLTFEKVDINAEPESSDEDDKDKKKGPLNNFVNILLNFISKGFCKKLTHLDLSGISAIQKDDVPKILDELADYRKCWNLISIHMSDLGINDDTLLYEEILDMFNIYTKEEQAKEHCGGLFLGLKMYLNKVRGVGYTRNKADDFNYTQVINEAINGKNKAEGKLHSILMGI